MAMDFSPMLLTAVSRSFNSAGKMKASALKEIMS
jgi:hypothetical protein